MTGKPLQNLRVLQWLAELHFLFECSPEPENHCWLIWDHSRPPGPAKDLFAAPNVESEPGARWCIVCRTPLPLTARADARLCSATCRKRDSRRGEAQRRTA
jgi:hypothetical protein